MKHHAFLIPFFIFLLSLQGIGQKFTFKEAKFNTIQKSYKNILIIGSGKVENRAFVDELTTKMANTLLPDSIKFEYRYLGKNTTQANSQIKQLLSENFDALIVFSPTDSLLYYKVTTTQFPYPSITPQFPNPQYTIPRRTIYLETEFTIQLFDPQDHENSIWDANLYVEGDISKKYLYSDISKKLIASLKANKILY